MKEKPKFIWLLLKKTKVKVPKDNMTLSLKKYLTEKDKK